MLEIKCDINQQYLRIVDLHFVKSELFSLTWSCGSRQRDTTSSEWKFRLNNLAVKGLNLLLLLYTADNPRILHILTINPYITKYDYCRFWSIFISRLTFLNRRQLLRTKCVLKHQYLQMFGYKFLQFLTNMNNFQPRDTTFSGWICFLLQRFKD